MEPYASTRMVSSTALAFSRLPKGIFAVENGRPVPRIPSIKTTAAWSILVSGREPNPLDIGSMEPSANCDMSALVKTINSAEY